MKKDKHLLSLIRKAVEASFQNGRINEKKVKDFVSVFKKLPHYKAIFALTEYLKGLKLRIEERTLHIEATTKLSGAELKSIQNSLEKNLKYDIGDLKFEINTFLLGGFRVKIGDTVFDYSLKNRINQVKEAVKGA